MASLRANNTLAARNSGGSPTAWWGGGGGMLAEQGEYYNKTLWINGYTVSTVPDSIIIHAVQ